MTCPDCLSKSLKLLFVCFKRFAWFFWENYVYPDVLWWLEEGQRQSVFERYRAIEKSLAPTQCCLNRAPKTLGRFFFWDTSWTMESYFPQTFDYFLNMRLLICFRYYVPKFVMADQNLLIYEETSNIFRCMNSFNISIESVWSWRNSSQLIWRIQNFWAAFRWWRISEASWKISTF